MADSILLPHRWPGAPILARLLERENRFLARCRLGSGEEVHAHVPDRGRCLDLLVPGQELVLVAVARPAGAEQVTPPRRTSFTALLARAKSAPQTWVCLDPAGAPRLVEAALGAGLLPSLAGLVVQRREVTLQARGGTSRIDLLLGRGEQIAQNGSWRGPAAPQVLCEVKSVGAAREGVAYFPDAPSERASRHLRLLAARARRGEGAAVVLCAQRGDVHAIAADEETDPAFARALQRARRAGVRVAGLRCEARPEGMAVLEEIPVRARA